MHPKPCTQGTQMAQLDLPNLSPLARTHKKMLITVFLDNHPAINLSSKISKLYATASRLYITLLIEIIALAAANAHHLKWYMYNGKPANKSFAALIY